MTARLVFLHGLESGPHGSKFQALRSLDPEIVSPDCAGVTDMGERLEIIGSSLAGIGRLVLVGSSFGGLAALHFAQDPANRERIAGCLLCAPALTLPGADSIEFIPANTIILHGTRDDIVPIQSSRDFASSHPLRLLEVDDDHRLSASAALVVSLAAELLGKV